METKKQETIGVEARCEKLNRRIVERLENVFCEMEDSAARMKYSLNTESVENVASSLAYIISYLEEELKFIDERIARLSDLRDEAEGDDVWE